MRRHKRTSDCPSAMSDGTHNARSCSVSETMEPSAAVRAGRREEKQSKKPERLGFPW